MISSLLSLLFCINLNLIYNVYPAYSLFLCVNEEDWKGNFNPMFSTTSAKSKHCDVECFDWQMKIASDVFRDLDRVWVDGAMIRWRWRDGAMTITREMWKLDQKRFWWSVSPLPLWRWCNLNVTINLRGLIFRKMVNPNSLMANSNWIKSELSLAPALRSKAEVKFLLINTV